MLFRSEYAGLLWLGRLELWLCDSPDIDLYNCLISGSSLDNGTLSCTELVVESMTPSDSGRSCCEGSKLGIMVVIVRCRNNNKM